MSTMLNKADKNNFYKFSYCTVGWFHCLAIINKVVTNITPTLFQREHNFVYLKLIHGFDEEISIPVQFATDFIKLF